MDVGVLLLALEDFLPVVLSGVALWVLARASLRLDTQAGRHVQAAFALIVLGGITKPIYKLVLALSGGEIDLVTLDRVLFWLLAPGFFLLVAGLRAASRVDSGTAPNLGIGGIIRAVGVFVAAATLLALGSGAWFGLLLVGATVGNVLAVVVLIRWARRRGEPTAAVMYGASLAIVFGLAWAAARLEQTVAVQWGEQLFSTASQGLFLWASLRLVSQMRQQVAAAG